MTPTQKDSHRHYRRSIWSLAWEIDNTAYRLRRCRASICVDAEQRYNTCLLTMWADLDMKQLRELRTTLRVIRDHIARAHDLL